MRIIRAIIIAAMTIPAFIFVLFFGVGLMIMVITLFQSGEYNKGWFGMVYAGSAYGYFAVLLSSIPTIAFGLPASFLAKKCNVLNRQVILLGAFLLGAIFLAVAGAFIFKSYSIQVFLWLFAVGGIGGLINGAVFIKQMKPNNSSNLTGAQNAPSS